MNFAFEWLKQWLKRPIFIGACLLYPFLLWIQLNEDLQTLHSASVFYYYNLSSQLGLTTSVLATLAGLPIISIFHELIESGMDRYLLVRRSFTKLSIKIITLVVFISSLVTLFGSCLFILTLQLAGNPIFNHGNALAPYYQIWIDQEKWLASLIIMILSTILTHCFYILLGFTFTSYFKRKSFSYLGPWIVSIGLKLLIPITNKTLIFHPTYVFSHISSGLDPNQRVTNPLGPLAYMTLYLMIILMIAVLSLIYRFYSLKGGSYVLYKRY